MDKFCHLGDMFSVDRDADAAVETRIRIGWNKFRQLVTLALQKAEMRIVRWMCGVQLQDRVQSNELKRRLGLDDIISVLQQTGCDGMGMCCEKKIIIG